MASRRLECFLLRSEYPDENVELGLDRERCGPAAEELEVEVEVEWSQPRSVARLMVEKRRKSIEVQAHSQIRRIRAEDSHMGEDIGEGNLRLKDRFGVTTHFMLFSSRPILPASPLSGTEYDEVQTGHE